MFKWFLEFGGSRFKTSGGKLVNMGCNGTSVFQGHQTNMTLQFKGKVTPFLNGVPCVGHLIKHRPSVLVGGHLAKYV
jgi:hypothetical protein